MSSPSPAQRDLIEKLYVVFSKYRPEKVFNCKFCHTTEQISYYRKTPVRSIPAEEARIVLWETGDHWESSEAYRHFLPRLLEVMAPPDSVEDMYPTHIMETLLHHDFREWPNEEKDAVLSYLLALNAADRSDSIQENEWNIALRKLANDA